MALQFPQLQTAIAKRAVSSIEPNICGNIQIGRIAIVFFNKVMAYDVSVTGNSGDTLAAFRKLSVTVSPREILKGHLKATRIFIEDGCFNFINEGPGHFSNLNRIFNFMPTPDSLKKPLRLPDLSVDNLTLRNMRFTMVNLEKDTASVSGRMNYSNLQLSGINARINRIRIHNNAVSCRIVNLGCMDHSGYRLVSLAGSLTIDSSGSRINSLKLTDSYSDITAGYLTFRYSSGKDFRDFVNKVKMGADFKNSILDFRSLGYFAHGLQNNDARMTISGEITGTVSDLSTNDLEINSMDSTYLRFGATVSGLPDIDSTFINVNIKEFATVFPELSRIIKAFSHKDNNIKNILPDTRICLRGLTYGTLSDLYSVCQASSDEGNIGYELSLKKNRVKGTEISSLMWAENINVGKLLNNKAIGRISFNTGLRACLPPHRPGGISADLDSLRISGFTVNGYRYENIMVTGEMRDNTANIRLVSHDNALPTMFQSIIDIDSAYSVDRIKIFMDVPYADLTAMNLVKKNEISNLGLTVGADLKFTDNKSILGNILIDNISYTNDNGQYHVDSLYIRSAIMQGKNVITIKSPVLHADYSSTDSPSAIKDRIKMALTKHSLKDIIDIDTSFLHRINGHYDFHLRTLDMSQVCDIIHPGLYIADNTTVNISMDENDIFNMDVNSSALSFNTSPDKIYNLDNISVHAGNSGNINGNITVGRIESGNILMDNLVLNVTEDADRFRTLFRFNNADTTYMNFHADVNFRRDNEKRLWTDISIDSSNLNIRGHRWNIYPANLIFSKDFYEVDGFRIAGTSDDLRIAGTVSKDKDSQLSLQIAGMDLSALNSFIPADIGIGGIISGEIELFNFYNGMGASMEINGDGLSIFGNDLGSLSVLSRRDLARNRFNILINNYIQNKNPINISGHYIPERNYLNLNLTLDHMSLTYLSPLLSDYVEISSGSISGDIIATGQPDRLMLNSENTRLDSLVITPAMTRVPYTVSGPLTLTQSTVELKGIDITDPKGAKAVLNGQITHNSFREIYLDAGLSFRNMMCLNTLETDNDKFYGTAYATGNIGLSGYTDNLLIDAQVTTSGNSSIHIPLSSSSSASSADLISYTDFSLPEDSLAAQDQTVLAEKNKRKRNSNLEIKARASITQGTELLIEMNKQLGDILRCTGTGEIDLTLNPSKNITDIRGDYTVSEGSYHFNMAIQSRDFTLNEGGSISFNGDLKNTNLNVGATYRTKASISTLISDTTSVGNRRNVNCGIQLQGSLSNPELSFSIDIPDLDPITKGRVESALSTPDKIQKQFMALLISGSFVPDEQSGIVNNSTILYSNASEILSNQFNNIFRQLDIPLDLGLNYQPGTGTGGKDMFDVAISYQAFNNRLIINGNLGNSETSSNWAGDFEAEIKVDRQGNLRITLFTRSADTYSNYLDNTQRSGFGITYQDEFDTFGDFWRNIFYSRKRKEEYELLQIMKAEEELEQEAKEANIVKEEIRKPKENPMNFTEDTGYTEYREGQ